MKKRIILISICIITILIIIIFNMYEENVYSIEYFIEILERNSNPISNMIIKDETFTENNNESTYSIISYIKDNTIHTFQYNNGKNITYEMVYDFDNLELITVSHEEKVIEKTLLNESDNKMNFKNINSECAEILKEISKSENLKDFKFKYCGKQKISDKNCLKISISDKTEFYIDCETNNIIMYKQDYLNDDNEIVKNEITYSYDSVIDSDIQFDINNYPDYTLQGEIN